jgi:hypothetical protein
MSSGTFSFFPGLLSRLSIDMDTKQYVVQKQTTYRHLRHADSPIRRASANVLTIDHHLRRVRFVFAPERAPSIRDRRSRCTVVNLNDLAHVTSGRKGAIRTSVAIQEQSSCNSYLVGGQIARHGGMGAATLARLTTNAARSLACIHAAVARQPAAHRCTRTCRRTYAVRWNPPSTPPRDCDA